MKNKAFEKLLTQSLQEIPPMDSGFAGTVRLARCQAARRRQRIPFRRFLASQIRYIGWPLWLLQGLLLLILDRMLLPHYGDPYWGNPFSMARLLFCISTLVAMMALPLLYRSRKHRMQEIESATYFSSSRLLLAKLAVIGVGDAALLGGIFLTAMVRTSMQAGNLTFCLLLPFLILSAAYLYMLGHCSGSSFFVGSITLGAVMILCAIGLPGRWLPLTQQGIGLGTGVCCLGLLSFSAHQLRYLLSRCPYTELQVI